MEGTMMRYPQSYVSQWFGYWAFLSDQSMQKWFEASEEIEKREYGTDKMLSDVMGFWNDAVFGWCAALRGAEPTVPTLFFYLRSDDRSATNSTPVFRPSLPFGDPQIAFL